MMGAEGTPTLQGSDLLGVVSPGGGGGRVEAVHLRVEDNDDAEEGQQSAENQRDPPVGAEHFTEAKPVGFSLEIGRAHV